MATDLGKLTVDVKDVNIDRETLVEELLKEFDRVLHRSTTVTLNKPHPHAELMKQYAKDAAETDRPWERWEVSAAGEGWKNCRNHPNWHRLHDYRRKPRTININGHEVPEPVRKPLERGQEYFRPEIAGARDGNIAGPYRWDDDCVDRKFLQRGLIHLTQEAAEAHVKALLSFTEVSDEKD